MDFKFAIVRIPGRSVINGLTEAGLGKPNYENMTPDELGKAYKEAQTKEEKDVIWKEQLRRQGIK